jgi:hypothetical protein
MQSWKKLVQAWRAHRHAGLCASAPLVAAAVCLGIANTANAGFTTVTPTAASDIYSKPNILDHIYSGNFTLEGDGVDYSNGSLTAVRVSDFLPSSSTTDSPGPNATDQLWQSAGDVQSAVEVYSTTYSKTTSFGYIPTGGTYQTLFGISGTGYTPSGSGSFTPGAETFSFAAQNQSGLLSTLPSQNKDGADHFVTYEVDGLGGNAKTWLLFLDDYGGSGSNPDFDFDDLVFQVTTTPTTSTSVPEPASISLIAGGLALGLLLRFRPRLRTP